VIRTPLSSRLVAVAAIAGLLIVPAVAAAAGPAGSLQAETLASSPELTETSRLADRRSLVVGDRAYAMSTADTLYPAAGWHIRGEMGGVWTPPIKLVDGIWVRVADEWLGDPDGAPATKTTVGWGYTRTAYASVDQVAVERTDFVPDGTRATLVGLTLTSPQPRTVPVALDAHSELMSAYPWGWTTPNAGTFNLQDTGAYDQDRHTSCPKRFGTRLGRPRGGQPHAAVPSARTEPPRPAGPGRGLPRRRPGAADVR
jgi:hypothetical protein